MAKLVSMKWQDSFGTGGRIESERFIAFCHPLQPIPIQTSKVAGLNRNTRQVSFGMGGRFASEQVAGLDRNTQSLEYSHYGNIFTRSNPSSAECAKSS